MMTLPRPGQNVGPVKNKEKKRERERERERGEGRIKRWKCLHP